MKKFFKRLIKSVLFLVLFIFLIAVLLVVFRNPIAKYVIEKTGSAAAGAKVEVDGVYLKPLALHISWDRLQVTDRNNTMSNLFETSSCEFELAFSPLLDRKVIIDNMTISEVRVNTKRTTDGKLPVKASKPKKPSKLMLSLKRNLEAEKEKIPVFKAKDMTTEISVDAIIEMMEFETPAKADSVKELAENRYNYWHDLIENNDYEARAKKIEKDIKKIDIENMDTLTEFQENFQLAQRSYTQSKALYDEFKIQKSQLEGDLSTMKELKRDIPQWVTEDYQKALQKAKLQDINVQNVALMVFGERVTDGIMLLLDQIERSRQMAKTEPAIEKVRKERYPHLPSFWIKNVDLSVITPDDIRLSGKVLDISSDQKKTKLPLKLNLKGNQDNVGRIVLGAIFDYTGEEDKETINLNISDVPITNVTISNFDLLPSKLKSGDARLNSSLNFANDLIVARIDLKTSDIVFDYNTQTEMDKNLVRISRNITEAIKDVDVHVEIQQRLGDFTFKINSNLDNLIASQLKKVASDELVRARAELEKRVNKELNKYKAEAYEFIDLQKQKLQSELNKVNNEIENQLMVVDSKKKELEDRLEEEKKKLEDKAMEEAGEVIDDLLDDLKF